MAAIFKNGPDSSENEVLAGKINAFSIESTQNAIDDEAFSIENDVNAIDNEAFAVENG